MAETQEQTTATQQAGTGDQQAPAGRTHERTVSIALFRYRDPESNAMRVAFRGETVALNDRDLARAERMGALLDDEQALGGPGVPVVAPRTPDRPEPSGLEQPQGAVAPHGDPTDPALNIGPIDPAAQPAVVGPSAAAPPAQQQGGPERPKLAESVAKWREYAVARGEDPETADDLTKDQLIEKYGRS